MSELVSKGTGEPIQTMAVRVPSNSQFSHPSLASVLLCVLCGVGRTKTAGAAAWCKAVNSVLTF